MGTDTRRSVVISGGAAGISAAYTLKKHGFDPVLLEANDYVGGRIRGDKVDGFSIDTGADFFCSSYDVAFQLCEELDLSLIRSKMKLGWFRNGRWVTSTPGHSPLELIRNLPDDDAGIFTRVYRWEQAVCMAPQECSPT